jgi:sugar phosphate isomerase/epimerase
MRQNRRKFIQLTASATTALLTTSMELFALTHKPTFNMNNKFELMIMATNWGFPGSLEEYCEKAKKEGYDGIEIWWPMEKEKQDELFTALKNHGLAVGFLCAGSDSNYEKHFDQFVKMIDAAATQRIQKPLYINCHSGRDHFSFEQNKRFIDHTLTLAKENELIICHETHRSRILYAAPVARQFIEKIPGLRLTLDISHWCNVHESLLQDQEETVDLALTRVDHIHARIGHPEGPQVNDPRAPEWDTALKAHFGWWDKVVEQKRKNGQRLTILTEFGPPDYMPVLPYTRQPLADQWAINAHILQLLRKRYLA